jgi:TorA maturation chaperone TorD
MNLSNNGSFDWTGYLVGEKLLLSLLSKMIYTAPEADWLQMLVSEDVFSEAPIGMEQPDIREGLAYLQGWSVACKPQLTTEQVEEIQSDHLKLFIGAGKVLAPPWGSVYLSEERLLFQKETLDVRRWYHRYGLQAERERNEPDDHIALELSFLSHLAGLALEALAAGDPLRFNELIGAQSRFLDEHLGKWAGRWSSLVLKHARSDFYRGAALLVRGAVADLTQVLNTTSKEGLEQ